MPIYEVDHWLKLGPIKLGQYPNTERKVDSDSKPTYVIERKKFGLGNPRVWVVVHNEDKVVKTELVNGERKETPLERTQINDDPQVSRAIRWLAESFV